MLREVIKKNISRIFIIVISTLLLFGCKTRVNEVEESYYSKSIQIIVNDSKIKDVDNLVVSNEIIPFHLESIYSGIIRRSFIKDYDEIKNYDSFQVKKIEKLIDSLSEKNKIFNSDYTKNQYINQKINSKRVNRKTKFVVFFSNIKDGFLYAELRKYDFKINSKKLTSDELSFGLCYCFLFKINDNKSLDLIADGTSNLN